ncbi:MAG: HNH endonuclease [Gammaproteobacteria bacterium]|nr:HNH endonuclease [Gammaproteobacteria bacterium]MYF30004.1 HNH endonuclease [Gammaproteobacteria bacterium]
MTPNHTAEQATAEGADERAARLGALARSLKVIRSDKSYLAVTLTSDGDGWDFSFHSSFAGFPDGKGADHGVELREPSLVYPERMTRIWDTLGQSWIVVNEDAQLAVYLRLGGHALIAEDVAQRHLAEFTEPQAYINLGPMGFRLYDPECREAQQPRPRPRLKKRVFARDGDVCQMCGNAPAKEDELSLLQAHHIKPFGKGGPTAEDNLITLCRGCHEGLDPHDQPWRFWYSDAPMFRALDELDAEAHDKGVEAYRRLVAKAIDKLDRREHAEPSRSRGMGLQSP